MIPLHELYRLHQAVLDALSCALDGLPAAGRDLLDFQLTWAETPPLDPHTLEPEPPDPWAEELTQLCRQVLVDYCALCDQLAALPHDARGEAGRRALILRWRARYWRTRSAESRADAREARRQATRARGRRSPWAS